MKDNVSIEFKEFYDVVIDNYIDNIRGDNKKAFTRNRKIGDPRLLLLQMFAKKGQTQNTELINFYKDIDKPLDISAVAFFKSRMNFNAEAIRIMSNDFTKLHYEKHIDKMAKLNGYFILAVDGSDIIMPDTEENEKIYGRSKGGRTNSDNMPIMGKLSTMCDCVNRLVLDSQIERYKYSEIKLAERHIENVYDNFPNKTITVFDRGYVSLKLAYKIMDSGKYFLFRLKKSDFKEYQKELNVGDDKDIEFKFDMKNTNQYRNDTEFRNRLLNDKLTLRMVKILVTDNGSNTEEVLLTNIPREDFDIDALKEIYHLRWNIETVYNVLKNKMKLEEYSGYRNQLVRQDIYSTIWLYNLIQMYIIQANEEDEIPSDRYTYEMQRNTNQIIGVVKSYFVKNLMQFDNPNEKDLDMVGKLIKIHLIPVRKNRHYERKNVATNKSRISYRYSY